MPFYRVALTGNVASGKSTVLALFRAWGAATTDADALAREAVQPGSATQQRIAEQFGSDLILPNGTLDRARLRRRVMDDPVRRAALEAIIHPEVARRAAELEAAARQAGASIIVHDIPLLFEVLDPGNFDAVVLVDAPYAERRRRLIELRGLSPPEADQLLAAQLPAEPKRARATWTIDNDGDLGALEARAREIWERLQAAARSA